jgi:methionyl-tRNA formyltransferase
VDDANSEELINRLNEIEPDLILSSGFPQIFSKELLEIPKKGAVNLHPSLLPKFRGPSPFFWTIASGETESGITAHFMTEDIDGGDIIAQIKYPIPDFTYEDLAKKCIEEIPNLIREVHNFFLEGTQAPQKQDATKASYFRYEKENDCRLLWDRLNVRQIYNLTRTGRAFCFFRNRKIGVTKCSIAETGPNTVRNVQAEKGTIINSSPESLMVTAQDGYISIREVIFQARTMSAQKFKNRLGVKIGETFS